MRKRHVEVELIEVFSPADADAWNDRPPDRATDDAQPSLRQPRRGVALTGLLVVVAFVAGAVATSDDNPSESASTTTDSTTTTMRELLAPSAPTHFLLDDPTLTPYSADIVTPPADGQQVRVYTNGTPAVVVIIELHPRASKPYGTVGATRSVEQVTEIVRSSIWCPKGVAPESTCEMLRSDVAIAAKWSITARAWGLNASEFVRVVGGVDVIDGAVALDIEVASDLRIDLMLDDVSVDDLLFGRVETAVRYLTPNGDVATLRSGVGSADRRLVGVRYLALDARQSFDSRTYGYLPESGAAIVVWEADGRLLSLVAPGDAEHLAELSQQVRPASESEWTSMMYGLRPDFRVGRFETLATGQDRRGDTWVAGPQLARRAGRTEYLWWWTVPGDDGATDGATDSDHASPGVGYWPHFDTVVVPGATFVFVSHPDSGGAVTVRTESGGELHAELTQPFGSQNSVFMAVVRVEETGPVTVEIDGVAVGL